MLLPCLLTLPPFVPRCLAADLPESSGAAEQRAQQAQRAQRKVTKNPGSRLRNELKRKSLAIGACCARCAVLAGLAGWHLQLGARPAALHLTAWCCP
jgi:hypothetical protein